MCKYQLLQTGNRHVMSDERGVEYFYHPVRGWLPGRKERRRFVWDYIPNSQTRTDRKGQLWFHEGRFYDKKRTYELINGPKVVRATRYSYGSFTKPDSAPKGRNGQTYKQASKRCRRAVYYDGELFYKACNLRISEDEWKMNQLVPYSGYVYDVYPGQSAEQGIPVVAIHISDGKPYSVEMDGERFDVTDWPMYASVLQLRAA